MKKATSRADNPSPRAMARTHHYKLDICNSASLLKNVSVSPCFFLCEISRTRRFLLLSKCFLQPYFPNDSVVFALGNLCQDLLLVNYSKISDRQPFTYLVVYNLVWQLYTPILPNPADSKA